MVAVDVKRERPGTTTIEQNLDRARFVRAKAASLSATVNPNEPITLWRACTNSSVRTQRFKQHSIKLYASSHEDRLWIDFLAVVPGPIPGSLK